MNKVFPLCALLAALPAAASTIDTVTIRGPQPTSLPAQLPSTIEGITAEQLERTINATDSEDALKYFPSLLVRKRYIGDYNHAVLSTRASGTGNSARSMVYADGILLSNYLGNGSSFTPRWGMVSPDEIERVDVLYGPFSAAYAGNSAGAVVDYVTRMPRKFEVHARAGLARQDGSFHARQGSLSIGDRSGDLSWWVSLNRLDSDGQPMVIVNRMVSESVTPSPGSPVVVGAVASVNHKGQPWWLLGTSSANQTVQDQARIKLSWQFSPTLRLKYSIGQWTNGATTSMDSWLRDPSGKPVYAGNVVIGSRQVNLNGPSLAFAGSSNTLQHRMQGISLKSTQRSGFSWEAAASNYRYRKDLLRNQAAAVAGRITDMAGTAWHTAKLRAGWEEPDGGHHVEAGFERMQFALRTLVSSTADWQSGATGARFSAFNGNTSLAALFIQDTWRLDPQWTATGGLRVERWEAWGGELGNAARLLPFGTARKEDYLSPKMAMAYRLSDNWGVKASAGRAIRTPTVGELYQGSINGDAIIHTDPFLKPERSWTSELSAERSLPGGALRSTLFFERTADALYAQALTPTVNTVQNIDGVRSRGVELAAQANDAWMPGFDLSASATFTDSRIVANRGYAASVGKHQPRVPRWRANVVATFRHSETLSTTLAARYSGQQFGQLDNSDTNGNSYLGFSRFTVVDARVRWQFDRQWSIAAGVDNLGNRNYWAFHPYPRRTWSAELAFRH